MKRKLTIYIFLIAALSVVISSAVGVWSFHQREVEDGRQTLTELLSLMDAEGSTTDVSGLLKQFSQAAPDKRLTLIAPDGTVLGDTEKDIYEDHSDRPEVEQALADGSGENIRRSSSNGVTYLYEAQVFDDGVIARAAMPLSSVNTLALQATAGLLAAAVLSLCLAWVLARRLAANTAKPVEDAEVAVRQVDETLQSARSEFTANVTHELKTPLASIRLLADSILQSEEMDRETLRDFVSDIGEEADRLNRITEKLLALTRLDNGVARPMERVDLSGVVREVLHMLHLLAGEKQVELVPRLGDDCLVEGSRDDLYQVIFNLVENGVKYNVTGGRVTVTTSRAEGRVVLRVEDTGIGIPEEELSKIFDRFYRVDKSHSSGGTGLGLSIVKHGAAYLGAQVELHSEPGHGSTFTLTFPKAGA